MPECFKDKYIYNSKIYDSSSFDEDLIDRKNVVYEVIRLIDTKPFKLEDNYKRLLNTLQIAGIEFNIEFSQMHEEISLLAKINSVKEGNVKFVVFNDSDESSHLVYLIQHYYPNKEQLSQGVETVSIQVERENPNAKVINKTLREQSNKIIKEKTVFEILLIDHNGFLTEGSRSNLFFIKENVVYTSEDKYVLPGTVRKRAIEICNNSNIGIVKNKVKLDDISMYDAAFLTGTSLGILPIAKIDDFIFDANNDVLKYIQEKYQDLLK
jgi:branched-chain amino acid aminotransferase